MSAAQCHRHCQLSMCCSILRAPESFNARVSQRKDLITESPTHNASESGCAGMGYPLPQPRGTERPALSAATLPLHRYTTLEPPRELFLSLGAREKLSSPSLCARGKLEPAECVKGGTPGACGHTRGWCACRQAHQGQVCYNKRVGSETRNRRSLAHLSNVEGLHQVFRDLLGCACTHRTAGRR